MVAAASVRSDGFHGDDIAWLLDNAPGEVVIIRPDGADQLNGNGRHHRVGRADAPAIGVG